MRLISAPKKSPTVGSRSSKESTSGPRAIAIPRWFTPNGTWVADELAMVVKEPQMQRRNHDETSRTAAGRSGTVSLRRRNVLTTGLTLAGAFGIGMDAFGAAAADPPAGGTPASGARPLDARAEAKKIAFDRAGKGEKVLLLSGFPQTRRSWNRVIPLLSADFETIPADLPSFGDSFFFQAPATTENAGRVFHEFV